MVRPDIDIHKSANANALLRTNADKEWIMIDPNSSHYPNKHTHIVGTGIFVEETPLSNWTAPTTSIKGDTALVKFTDGIVGAYTYTTVWTLTFSFIYPITYYLWVGSLTQIGTNAPIGSQFNTSDINNFSITWARSLAGSYEGTLSMEFNMNRIPKFTIPLEAGRYAAISPTSESTISLTTFDFHEGNYVQSDDMLSTIYVEIPIYL